MNRSVKIYTTEFICIKMSRLVHRNKLRVIHIDRGLGPKVSFVFIFLLSLQLDTARSQS